MSNQTQESLQYSRARAELAALQATFYTMAETMKALLTMDNLADAIPVINVMAFNAQDFSERLDHVQDELGAVVEVVEVQP